ncbi:MAG: alginate lyase family protein [Flavobacteriaceae bacterium]
MKKTSIFLGILMGCVAIQTPMMGQDHPNLILTKPGVTQIRKYLGKVPTFDSHLQKVRAEVEAEIEKGIFVPLPKDMAGGYTHERHKRNFFMLQKAGVLYQILEKEAYAEYVKQVLMVYAKMYKSLPIHPQPRSYARGKIFWQCLNDSNWLVYVSQAYDCIYEYLTESERTYLENELFRPFADYISIENPQFFNRIHNHSTWGNAAVGLMALVLDDDDLLQRALYGIPVDNSNVQERDNDGGFIRKPGEKAGFLANIEAPFSPEGYYTEAPYYQRYAMYPYLVFAVGLHNKKPEYKIFEYKDGVLLKAVDALLNLTDSDGEFYPLNDAQKGMSYFSRELVSAVNIAYHYGDQNPGLLSIAAEQNRVSLDDAGFDVAQAIDQGNAQPFVKKSMELTDGPQGKQGGITVLRAGTSPETNLVAKYSAQGNSHGHYDKLSYSLYFDGHEILQDYGLARFVNIDQKNGGGYLKENKTWAKQTIAHNVLVQDETSHYQGDYAIGSQFHAEKYHSQLSEEGDQWISMLDTHAYPGTRQHRTLFLIRDSRLEHPLLIDAFQVQSQAHHQFDLPYHYLGQVMETDIELNALKTLNPLGKSEGYQHLWKRAQGKSQSGTHRLNVMEQGHFYTISFHSRPEDTYIFGQLGANDPEFNLRNDPVLIQRRADTDQTLFVNALEIHGSYSPITEIATNARTTIQEIQVLLESAEYSVFRVQIQSNQALDFCIAHQNADEKQSHQRTIQGQVYQWTGPIFIQH